MLDWECVILGTEMLERLTEADPLARLPIGEPISNRDY